MVYNQQATRTQPYQHKPGSGTIFKNPEYQANGDPEDSNNYWGDMTINVDGQIWKARLYPKTPGEGKKPYIRVSLYQPEPKPQAHSGSNPQQYQQNSAESDDGLPF